MPSQHGDFQRSSRIQLLHTITPSCGRLVDIGCAAGAPSKSTSLSNAAGAAEAAGGAAEAAAGAAEAVAGGSDISSKSGAGAAASGQVSMAP